MALPTDILKERIKNELGMCEKKLPANISFKVEGGVGAQEPKRLSSGKAPGTNYVSGPRALAKNPVREPNSFPVRIRVDFDGVASIESLLGGKTPKLRMRHSFTLELGKDYPYQKPSVAWQTPIFHPNISPPEEGGLVCTKAIDGWKFSSSLCDFIMSVELLLSNPNPASPLATETCTMAAEYLNKNGRNLCKAHIK